MKGYIRRGYALHFFERGRTFPGKIDGKGSMVPTLQNILDLLESVSPASLAEPWDNPGLQVGFPPQKIGTIFTSLDPTPGALQRALDMHAQMLLTHHPLIFKPISQINPENFPGDVIVRAVKNDVAVVCAHTNLDASMGGINDILADILGLVNVEILKENTDSEKPAGLGRIGDLRKPLPLDSVLQEISRTFHLEQIKVAGKKDVFVRRLAVVGGSGGSLLREAHRKRADLFLTGDVTHHVALDAETLGVVLVDGGHFSLENEAFRVFGTHLQKLFKAKKWEVSLKIDEKEADPLRLER